MQKQFLDTTLLKQEYYAAKLFIWLYYPVLFLYDLVAFVIYPILSGQSAGIPADGLSYWFYVLQVMLLPVALYLLRSGRASGVKYLYFVSYALLSALNEMLLNFEDHSGYIGGNIVELVILLFSPIFVNRRFFYTVSLGLILKYAVVGLVLQQPAVAAAIILVLGVSVVAYILLNRFLGYISAIQHSYNEQMEKLVKGVAAILELKDPYTRGHSERVTAYTLSFARSLGLFTEDKLKILSYSCLLHDIGKVHIPEHILSKPGALTEEEFRIIKLHPAVGADAVGSIPGMESSTDVIRHHHERWDGHGYPDQLKGLDIPLFARIAAIADAFDAMTSARSYRGALRPEQAYAEIMNNAGLQFDPQLVGKLEKVFPEWVRLAEAHRSERDEPDAKEVTK